MNNFDFEILPRHFLDVLDVVVVLYLIYQLYRLLRGSIAFNIFVGLLLLYGIWWLVRLLGMSLLSGLLGQFVSLGVIMLLIVFQPEVRRFLLLLGNSTLRQRSHFLGQWLDRRANQVDNTEKIKNVKAIKAALLKLSRNQTGALIVFANTLNREFFNDSGVVLNALISQPLLESIFSKDSPLHDGAMVISDHQVHAASCILPLSSNPELPKSLGLRHRAGVGVSENFMVAAFIVSEENGAISFAQQGKLQRKLEEAQLEALLLEWYR